MKMIDFTNSHAEQIEAYGSVGAASVLLGSGEGEAHAYSIRFEPGGKIGEHVAGFGQLFLVIEGAGWVTGNDRERVELIAGQGAYFARGETHSKGSEFGMTAIMIQVFDFWPADALK
jgi:quercetin dioxygenase-like cupin family protein